MWCLPVYTVCPEGQDGPTRTLHRDLLLPCGFLSEVEEEHEKARPTTRPRTRRTPIQPEERPQYSEEKYNSLLFYPFEMIETEARVLEPVSVAFPGKGIETGSKTGPQTKLSPDLESIPEMEPGNLSVNLPKPSTIDASASEPVER